MVISAFLAVLAVLALTAGVTKIILKLCPPPPTKKAVDELLLDIYHYLDKKT